MTEADLLAVLSHFGKIRGFYIPSPASPFNLCALVILGTNKEADLMVQEFNGAHANKQKLVMRNLLKIETHSLDHLRRLL